MLYVVVYQDDPWGFRSEVQGIYIDKLIALEEARKLPAGKVREVEGITIEGSVTNEQQRTGPVSRDNDSGRDDISYVPALPAGRDG